MTLFIYGSLKVGGFNHERFGFDKLKFLGNHTLSSYELWEIGQYPGMVYTGLVKNKVKGELYEVDEEGKDFLYLKRVEEGAGFQLAQASGLFEQKPIFTFLYKGYVDGYTKIEGGEWKPLESTS